MGIAIAQHLKPDQDLVPYFSKSPITSIEPITHNIEKIFAKFLDSIGVKWEYESRNYVSVVRTTRMWGFNNKKFEFRPDFYLPEFDMFVEVTSSERGSSGYNFKHQRASKLRKAGINISTLSGLDIQFLMRYNKQLSAEYRDCAKKKILSTADYLKKKEREILNLQQYVPQLWRTEIGFYDSNESMKRSSKFRKIEYLDNLFQACRATNDSKNSYNS